MSHARSAYSEEERTSVVVDHSESYTTVLDNRAHRFLFRLITHTAEQIIPNPIAFVFKVITDFRELYYLLPRSERRSLSTEANPDVMNTQALGDILYESLKTKGYGYNGLKELIHVLMNTLWHNPASDQFGDTLSSFTPKSWHKVPEWPTLLLHSSKRSAHQTAGRTALAQTWLDPLNTTTHSQLQLTLTQIPQIKGLNLRKVPLGYGASAVVYHATPQTEFWRDLLKPYQINTIALKVGALHALTRFKREVEVMQSIQSAALCPALDAGVIARDDAIDLYWIAMPNYGGATLAQLLKSKATLLQRLILARTILEGLCTLHERHIIHRDLKPANVLISETFEARLSDFGLARGIVDHQSQSDLDTQENNTVLDKDATQTESGQLLVGTPAYMSPEQLSLKTLTTATDLWSFGAVFYELLTKERLFRGETIPEVWGSILHQKLRFKHSKVPVEIKPLLRACLQRKVSQRITSAQDLLDTYGEVLTSLIQQEQLKQSRQNWHEILSSDLLPLFFQKLIEEDFETL